VAGVHAPADADPADIAWKALAANISDLVAMAATPRAYLLSVVWPKTGPDGLAERLVQGLSEAQQAFACRLVGGDTTRADAPLTLSITAIGETPGGVTPRRANARVGDVLVLVNTVGDAFLGLQLWRGELDGLDPPARARVRQAFLRPRPPVAIIQILRRLANAAIDVSDGLLADAGHIAAASHLGAVIDLADIPASAAGAAWIAAAADPVAARLALASGGDDYQIVAAMPRRNTQPFIKECAALGHTAQIIGEITQGEGLAVRFNGAVIETGPRGFTHF
jgi:thiamine-monophosphate kinase